MEPIFFTSPADFRSWLEDHHATETELLVGFYKKASGKSSMTWSQAVDEALCFGWIDGVVRRLDDERYTHRFTPRKQGSTWSAVNVAKVAELTVQGRMAPVGLAAYAARRESRTGTYAHENREAATLSAPQQAQLEADEAAWSFFQTQPAGYRKTAAWWVISAKREETRARRLATLIEESAQGRLLRQFTRR